jgi:hypothetical protein
LGGFSFPHSTPLIDNPFSLGNFEGSRPWGIVYHLFANKDIGTVGESEGVDGMRVLLGFFLALVGLIDLADGASISAVLGGNRAGGFAGEAYLNYTDQSNIGSSQGQFASVPLAGPPDDNVVRTKFINGSFAFGTSGNDGVVETTVRRQGYNFFTTTHAYFVPSSGFVGGTKPMVVNSAYWEFTIDGIFDYEIKAQAPQITGNIRPYRFEKVGSGVIVQDSTGTSATTLNGTNISSGTYRLYYDHFNFSPNTSGPGGNTIGGTNLDISFTFKGEDNTVVPEPSSVAVFGLLSISSAIAKWRRKK